MLTGDSLPIAKQIAQEVGLGDKITRMADVESTRSQEVFAAEIVDKSDGFAEINPKESTELLRGCRRKSMLLE